MPKNILVLIAIIAAVAIILSVFSYQYSTSTAGKIVDIATHEIRSNAMIQAHDFAQILANRLESVTPLLETLAEAPSMQNNEFERSQMIISQRQNSTADLTDFYMWLDQDGKIIWISNMNSTTYQQYKGFDLSYRPYFTVPKDTHRPYYSSTIDSNDKVPRLYIAYPILSSPITLESGGKNIPTNNSMTKVNFKGVVVTAIEVNTLGNLLEKQLFPQFNSTIGLLDNDGVIIYTNNQSFVGKDVFGEEFQSTLRSTLFPREVKSLNDVIRISLQANNSGARDIPVLGKTNTLSYEPIIIHGERFLTLYISAPHNLAGDVGSAIDQQRNLSIVTVTIIGALAIGIAFLLITWNRRLENTVNARTTELKRANEQLKVNDKMQKEFINIASHEMKTPTQAILGFSELLEQHPRNRSEIVKAIQRNAARLHRLTNDILDVTRIESNTLKLNKEEFNLKDVIVNCINDVTIAKNMNNGKHVELLYEPKDIIVEGDRARVSQVISNLLSNAAKFTKEGDISITSDREDGNVTIRIKDTGTGVDSNIFPRLFNKFATKSDTGTGLGLFISKSIIEAHGGKIWAENNSNGRGATFSFTIPLS